MRFYDYSKLVAALLDLSKIITIGRLGRLL